ncbi:MAG: NADP-dependent oxidoreductase [Sphingopyxis sp.]
MRHYVQTGHGQVSGNVALVETADPEPNPGEILVEVHAAALNPVDFKIVHGALKPVMKVNLPDPMGFDGSGLVRSVGQGVTLFKAGEPVFFRADLRHRGSFAEAFCVAADCAAIKPDTLSHAEAASLPLVALTTVQGLVDRAGAKAGQSILIHAGSGGVGSFAVQYAKAIGMAVTATTSARNADMVRALGADHVIEYDKQDYRDSAARYDIVYDTLGGDCTLDAFKMLKPGGALVSIAGPPTTEMADQLKLGWFMHQAMAFMSRKVRAAARRTGTRYFGYFTESSGAQLADIAGLVDAGKIRAVIDREYPFEQLVEALEHLETGRARGKIVLSVR